MNVKIWKKDSYGLFDYESDNMEETKITSSMPGVLLKKSNEVFFVYGINEK